MGFLSRRYADPLKYASRGSTLSAYDNDDFSHICNNITKTLNAVRKTWIFLYNDKF